MSNDPPQEDVRRVEELLVALLEFCRADAPVGVTETVSEACQSVFKGGWAHEGTAARWSRLVGETLFGDYLDSLSGFASREVQDLIKAVRPLLQSSGDSTPSREPRDQSWDARDRCLRHARERIEALAWKQMETGGKSRTALQFWLSRGARGPFPVVLGNMESRWLEKRSGAVGCEVPCRLAGVHV